MGLPNRAYRNVFRKAARTFLVVFALGFSIAAILSVYTGIEASTANTQDMIADYEQTIMEMSELSETQERLITLGGGGRGMGGGIGGTASNPLSTPITYDLMDNITTIEFVEEVIPVITLPVGDINIDEIREQMRSDGITPGQGGNKAEAIMSMYDYIIQGVPLDPVLNSQYSILPINIVEGNSLNDDDRNKVLLREDLTYSDGFFAGATVGQFVKIEDYSFQVEGIYSSDLNRNYVYMSIEDAQIVLDMDENEVSSLNIYVESKSVIDLVIYDIEELTGLTATSYADMNALFSERMKSTQEAEIAQLESDNEKIENTGNQVIIISLITAGLIVLFLMLYTVRERSKEIGILKALGFTGKNIMAQFVIEGIIIGFIGGIIGIIIGIVGGPFISEFLLPDTNVFATSLPSTNMILIVLCLTALLGAIGTIYPAWEASRKNPVEAMKHE